MALKTTQFGTEGYHKPTPKTISKIAAGIKGVCLAVSGASILNGHPYLAFSIVVLEAVCDQVSKFFYEE